jgi:hypothetical protein
MGSAGGACSSGGCGGLTGVCDEAPGGELGGLGAFMFVSVSENRTRRAKVSSRLSRHWLGRPWLLRQRNEFIGVEVRQLYPARLPVGLGLLDAILSG